MIPSAIILAGAAVAAALVTHWVQLSRAVRASRVAATAERDRLDAAESAAQDELSRESAATESAQKDAYFRSNPRALVELTRSRMHLRLEPVTHAIAQLKSSHEKLSGGLLTAEHGVAPALQLVCCVALAFLPIAFALSASQLVPSFRALSATPSGVDVLLGFLLASAEIAVAFLLAGSLRPAEGWSPMGPKLTLAVAATFAASVIAAQVAWAPAHDTIPLRTQIASAKEALAIDQTANADPAVIATDEQQISTLTDKLTEVANRDQGLALIVTMGADVSAWPALLGIGYLSAARRRRQARSELTRITTSVAELERQRALIPIETTIDLQAELVRLGHDPEMAIAGDRGSAARPGVHRHEPDQQPGGEATSVQARRAWSPSTSGPVQHPADEEEADVVDEVSPAHLFMNQSPREDRSWSDPL